MFNWDRYRAPVVRTAGAAVVWIASVIVSVGLRHSERGCGLIKNVDVLRMTWNRRRMSRPWGRTYGLVTRSRGRPQGGVRQ